jgi:hypothetical protein
MELVVVVGSLILLALAAPRWGHDSRRHDAEPWLGDRGPAERGAGTVAAALVATHAALARLRREPRAHAPRRRLRARTASVLS